MTFFTASVPQSVRPPAGLGQRGRAGLELLGATQKYAASHLRPAARAAFEASQAGADLARAHAQAAAPAEMRRVVAETTSVVERDPVWRMERFLQRYVGEESFAQGIQAVEERRAMFAAFLAPPAQPTRGTLELDPGLVPPKYYSATEWHLEPGSWDGYDLYGAVFAFGLGPLDRTLTDPHETLARLTGANVTPEAAVLIVEGKTLKPVYTGRIDDRYLSLGTERPAATRHDLEDALAAILANRPVPAPGGPPVGCAFMTLNAK